MNTLYPAIFTPQEPLGFHVQFVDMENVFTCGDTIEECLFNGTEVLTLMLECFLEDGKEIPRPSGNVEGAYYIGYVREKPELHPPNRVQFGKALLSKEKSSNRRNCCYSSNHTRKFHICK